MAKKLGETLVDGRLVRRMRLGALWEGRHGSAELARAPIRSRNIGLAQESAFHEQ